MIYEKFDVAIIGSGIAGSILAAILAKNGVSVALIDRGQHPRFAIGESMIPATSYLLRIMADRYDIPELDQCSTFLKQRKYVTGSSGIKRNFSFVHHIKGKPFNPAHSTMLPVPNHPHGPEAHLFRQDIDAFLFNAAIKYGAKSFQDTSIKNIAADSSQAVIQTDTDKNITCSYIVDGSGHNSVLAQMNDLRELPCRLKTHSRSIFTHMIGVKAFDDFFDQQDHGLPQLLSQGTLHHIFDGGWLWVIPFNNYESATNRLCSVGLQLDPRKYPATNLMPEEEFERFLQDYPEIQVQFEGAFATRKWVSTPRLQYSTANVVGDRFCLLAHAAGFVDPLFSRGLHVTMETINALAHRLIEAVKTDDFSTQKFENINRLAQGLIDSHDRLVHGSFISFADFELWNAWYRVWALGGTYTSLRFRNAHLMFKTTQDRKYLDELEKHEFVGTPCPELAEYQQVFLSAYAIMLKVESGELKAAEAVQQLYQLYDADWIPPMYELTNSKKRYISPGCIDSFVASNVWGYKQAPEHIREKYFSMPAQLLVKAVKTSIEEESRWLDALGNDFSNYSFDAAAEDRVKSSAKITSALERLTELS
jgi:tetracycline 7-halogenase / FADH2 O2-dependent halogenase